MRCFSTVELTQLSSFLFYQLQSQCEDGAQHFINSGSQAYQNSFLTTEFHLTYQKFENLTAMDHPKLTSSTQRMGDSIIVAVSVYHCTACIWCIIGPFIYCVTFDSVPGDYKHTTIKEKTTVNCHWEYLS